MVIKKFQAGTEKEAIMLAKEELGKDAIVMNIKTISPKGIYKLFRKPVVEVTAAVDENVMYSQVRKRPGREEQRIEALKNNPNIIMEEENSAFLNNGKDSIEDKLDNLQSLIEKQMLSKDDIAVKEKKKENDIEEISHNMECIQLIYNQLINNEVDEKYANQVISEIEGKLKKDAPVDQILSGIYQKIILKLGQAKTIEIDPDSKGKFIFFIGPTGVGKTTTIAKIASNLKITKKLKVAMVTADTYRIAAEAQLRTYADILQIPLSVIYSAEQMQDVIEEYADYDVILVDTAGRSHKVKEQRDDLEMLVNKIPEDKREIYLVLSATTKYNDLVKITETYKEITDYSLIFTKLDETGCIGNIFNIKMFTGANLSYATFGQNVPDDIIKIDPQNIAKQLLGGNE